MERETVKEEWHLSKSVPVAFIVTLVGQLIAAIWFFSQLASDVDQTKIDLDRLDRQVISMQSASQDQATRLARIEERLDGMHSLMTRIADSIERRP
jgi:Mg2+ and Co2+ transporter CorA